MSVKCVRTLAGLLVALALAAATPSRRAVAIRIVAGDAIACLTGVAEQHHVAILHDVLFAFEPNLGLFFRRGKAARREQIFPLHHVRFDEAALDVAVNGSGGLLCVHAALDGPRAAFRLAASEERD